MRAGWVAIAVSLVARLAAASDDTPNVQEHERLGRADTVAGHYAEALAEYEMAWQIGKRDVDLLNVARLRARLGRFVDSDAAFEEWEKLPSHDRDLEAAEKTEHAVVAAKTCTIRVRGAIDSLRVEGIEVHPPARVDPGDKHVEWRVRDHVTTRVVRCHEGSEAEIDAEPEARTTPISPVRSQRVPWVSLLVGGTGLALVTGGAITGGIGLDGYAKLEHGCGLTGTCDPANVRGVRGELAAADILVGTGLMVAAVAIVVYLTTQR